MYKIGWFSTGKDKAARDFLIAAESSIRRGEIDAMIDFVFLSRERGESVESDRFIQLSDDYNIPLVAFSHQKFQTRAGTQASASNELPALNLDYDREIIKRLRDYNPDLCILAGYMLTAGKEMCQTYNMINLHPGTPGGPSGTWQELIWKLMENNAQETGVTMRLVTPETDKCPVVTFCTFPIRGGQFDKFWKEIEGKPIERIKQEQGEQNPLFKFIRWEGFKRELTLLKVTIKTFSDRKVSVKNGMVMDNTDKPVNGFDLTREIEKIITEES